MWGSSASSLWYFHDDNASGVSLLEEYNRVASELKGMARVVRHQMHRVASVLPAEQGGGDAHHRDLTHEHRAAIQIRGEDVAQGHQRKGVEVLSRQNWEAHIG